MVQRMDRNLACGSVAGIALLLSVATHAADAVDLWSRADANRVCPVATVWRIGVGSRRGMGEAIETVVPLEVDGRAVWRITHTLLKTPEDVRNGRVVGFDFMDVERATLAPVQSEHRAQGSASAAVTVTRFDYRATPELALRLNADGSPAERIAVPAGRRLYADGPGDPIYDQAIAWSDGLRLRGYMVDRFRGRENERLREMEIVVTGRSSIELGGRRVETFVVSQGPVDGSFRSISHITVARPHQRVHVEYYASGLKEGARPFVSEAAALMQDVSCAKAR